MLSVILSLLLFGTSQDDVFKKEMGPLQAEVDSVILSTGAQVSQKSKAAYLDGYGVIVSVEVVFESPQNPFSGAKRPEEIRSLVAQRRKEVKDKMAELVKKHVATMDSIGASESLAIIVHVLNANPVDARNLPIQILFSAKKDSPQQIAFREVL